MKKSARIGAYLEPDSIRILRTEKEDRSTGVLFAILLVLVLGISLTMYYHMDRFLKYIPLAGIGAAVCIAVLFGKIMLREKDKFLLVMDPDKIVLSPTGSKKQYIIPISSVFFLEDSSYEESYLAANRQIVPVWTHQIILHINTGCAVKEIRNRFLPKRREREQVCTLEKPLSFPVRDLSLNHAAFQQVICEMNGRIGDAKERHLRKTK